MAMPQLFNKVLSEFENEFQKIEIKDNQMTLSDPELHGDYITITYNDNVVRVSKYDQNNKRIFSNSTEYRLNNDNMKQITIRLVRNYKNNINSLF